MDKTFDEAIAGIRKAERGVEVREDIAQGMEYVKQYADEVTDQQQAALQAAQTATGAANTATKKAAAAAESESAARTSAAEAAQSERSASADATNAASSAASAKAEADRAAAIVRTDKTLSVEGAPADAKAVGDALKNIKLPVATATTLGGIKSGKGLKISADGTASIDAYNTAETDSLLNALQKQVDRKISSAISSATSITASGDGYIRFADGTQICWLKFGEWPHKNYDPYFQFPVPFVDTNYGAGYAFGEIIAYNYDVRCCVFDRTTTGLCVRSDYEGSIVVIGRWK